MQDLFRHEALPFAGAPRFARYCAGAVRDGVESDERVIVLAASDRLDAVADRLGPDADEVTFVATDEHGRNPTRIATLLHTFETAGHGQRSLGVVDMSADGRSPRAAEELCFSDAVLNLPALRSWPMSVVCLFDSDRLDDSGMLGVRRCHAVVRGQDTNVDYDPDYGLEMYGADVEPPPPSAVRHRVGRGGLGGMREFVRRQAGRHDIAPDRVDDLVLAANEIVTNSLRHGGGQAEMAVWFADGAVVCEVCDEGFIDDPLAGRFAPLPSASSGRGLWLANHLCDLVQVRSVPGRSIVRMYVDR